jgi:hypothetical protein
MYTKVSNNNNNTREEYRASGFFLFHGKIDAANDILSKQDHGNPAGYRERVK